MQYRTQWYAIDVEHSLGMSNTLLVEVRQYNDGCRDVTINGRSRHYYLDDYMAIREYVKASGCILNRIY